MTPSPDDPLFRMLVAAYNRAGIRSIPVESTWERTILENLDDGLDPQCGETYAHLIGDKHHHGPAAYWGRINIGNHNPGGYLCAAIVEAIQEAGRVGVACSHRTHAVDDFVFTPLPEGNQ